MADCADNSDDKIEATVLLGRAKVERDAINFKLRPIVFEDIQGTVGICHWCESYIRPGNLFCTRDPQDEGMCCSESYDHDTKRRKETGT